MKGNLRLKGRGWTLGAFALGATAGSLVGLLFAPASGRITRKRIGMKFRSLEQSTVRQLRQTKRLLTKKALDLKDAASEKLVNTKDWLVERVANPNGKHARRALHHA